jgi:hypothetical protein
MPRRTSIRFPSFRNLQIYHELAYEKRTQTVLAQNLGLSQCRISQIARKVRAWVDQTLPPRHLKGDDGKRFHLAIARERVRLHDAYEPLVGMFTGPDGFPRYLRRQITVFDGQPMHTVEVSDKPDFRLLNQTVDVLGRMAELETIANRGPFANLPSQVNQTIVHHIGQPAELPTANTGQPIAVENPPKSYSNANIPSTNANENRGWGVLTDGCQGAQSTL